MQSLPPAIYPGTNSKPKIRSMSMSWEPPQIAGDPAWGLNVILELPPLAEGSKPAEMQMQLRLQSLPATTDDEILDWLMMRLHGTSASL